MRFDIHKIATNSIKSKKVDELGIELRTFHNLIIMGESENHISPPMRSENHTTRPFAHFIIGDNYEVSSSSVMKSPQKSNL